MTRDEAREKVKDVLENWDIKEQSIVDVTEAILRAVLGEVIGD